MHSRRGTLELSTEDTNEQSGQACTAAAVEYSASAGHHTTAVKDQTFFWVPVIRCAATLWTRCNLSATFFGTDARTELQWSTCDV